MALITSISGIRGTIGSGDNNLNPENFLNYCLSFGEMIKRSKKSKKTKIVVGRDARISGEGFLNIAINSLIFLGIDVVDLGLATTPTVEIAVTEEGADGGIIISASHNPREWNALKLLNSKGEFIGKKDGERLLKIFQERDFSFVDIGSLGKIEVKNFYTDTHIKKILRLPLIKRSLIKKRNFKVVVDGINSVGALAIKRLLKHLGIEKVIVINQEMNGEFSHNPEPIDKNLKQLCRAVKREKADLGIAVDPDVDRLSFVDEKGIYFGEENTLVAVSKYVLENYKIFKHKYKKNTVTNLSSSQALKDVSELLGGECFFSLVGEAHVVAEMKKRQSVVGGEGNGGIIFPELHYGRDALVGVALFLSYLASLNIKLSELKLSLPQYYLAKHRVSLKKDLQIENVFNKIEKKYKKKKVKFSRLDGLKIIFWEEKSWVHLRRSNTEEIIRIYCEAHTKKRALEIIDEVLIHLT